MRILIGIPTYDRRVDIEIVKGLLALEREGIDFDVTFPISSHISRNRNYCVHQCLRDNYDYLFFWDSDIALGQGFLKKMLDAAYKLEAEIVCGCYRIKDKEGKYVLGIKKNGVYENIKEISAIGEVDAGGTGCMLIHKKVFKKLADPWFTIVDGQNLFTMPEDFEFCRKAKIHGFKIIAVPTFETHHYGSTPWSHL